MTRIYLNDDWEFINEFRPELTELNSKAAFEKVRIPHAFAETPFNAFSPDLYQKDALYRRTFRSEESWSGKKVFLTVSAAAHKSEVFLNGAKLAVHECGYTAFTVDLTGQLLSAGQENLLAIHVDSRENLNQPPFGFVIDYMTYGGIYRDVWLDIKNPVYIEDVFVRTKGREYRAEVKIGGLSAESGENGNSDFSDYTVSHRLLEADKAPFTSNPEIEIKLWSLEQPYLYLLETTLSDKNGNIVDVIKTRFGFRDIRYDESGFYLNGEKIKIRGLNRHQSWPYVGYAMPDSMQREDADILKKELGLNEVRTSHYPQSQAFVSRCDEIGLLVFTEIPGWQHIGNSEWKEKALKNVRDMISQYRNHPSVFLWGVRINESQDDDELYSRTNSLAHELDSGRPTGGVRFLRNSRLLEDVYTFNDFSHHGSNEGCLPKKRVTKSRKGYMITEYNGHMYPTKSFDSEAHRTEHLLRHARVLDAVASHKKISGSSGWCAFDYNTHKDFGSGDYVCYHGVMDMFRNPKTAAFLYQSQAEADIAGDVLFVTSSMDIGEYPAGLRGHVYILTNADSVKFFVNDIFIKEFTRKDSPFKHLVHPPLLIDDYIGHRLVDEDGFKEKDSPLIKEIISAFQKYGLDKLPLKYTVKGLLLCLRGVCDFERLRSLYGKYIGNWGGASVEYRFESYRDGKLVKTLTKSPVKNVTVEAKSRRQILIEGKTYDVSAVSLSAMDENGNVQPFCQEALSLRTEGPIELIGPKALSLKGGMAACYVKSTGKAGRGTLIIEDWKGIVKRLLFEVRLEK